MNKEKRNNPIILHNSPSGAIERIIYTLLEKSVKNKTTWPKASISYLVITYTG